MNTPVAYQYQRALDQFRREGREPPLLKRMSELISLLDLTTTLNSGLSGQDILDAALLIVMGELQVSRGVFFVRDDRDEFRVQAARGLPSGAARSFPAHALKGSEISMRATSESPELFDNLGIEALCGIERAGRTIAALGLGPRALGGGYGDEESNFLRSVTACAATPIENGLIYDELRSVNQKLSVKIFQLRNLFEISRELTSSFDEEAIKNLVTTTLMGHLMVSRGALFLMGGGGLARAHARGLRPGAGDWQVSQLEGREFLDGLRGAGAVANLPSGPIRDSLLRMRMGYCIPLAAGGRTDGFFAIGERVSGESFTEEDWDFAHTLGQQAMAALEGLRLQRIRLDKERQDRELQIARGIQEGLFPRTSPLIPGFEVAASSRPCREVGGDYFDFIPLPGGRVGLVVADVSGKSTPASILMASVHASIRALAGTVSVVALAERLNAFLLESTQTNKFVTLFYAELDHVKRRLSYVNAGHVPPYLITADGECERLTVGGPVLGLLDRVVYESAEVELQPGDRVVMVTDGATEALSPDEREFGDEGVLAELKRTTGAGAAETLASLTAKIDAWTCTAGCTDDLTLLVLKAT